MVAATEHTDVLAEIRSAVESTTADRVFGDPITVDGMVLLPVARIAGGGGGGSGSAPEPGGPEGGGGGFGTYGRGLGVFVLKDGRVTWRPAIDVNRIVLGGQLVAITALLVVRGLARARGASRRCPGHLTGRRKPR
ncbi:sporulation protein [Paractinoplanes rishiriensis]|uniref:Sporulation protein YtfJ n=1 Tax=Paractinoplanes rishiriensis TaxID=1050105 RepID=A0A919K6Y5_9ACTN|nr:sporulation protein [Actinoplanes rishiriensis]GIF02092.1 hypothetical protein Ari01nite_95560 [Actinoplanes rishiriensis]